jgi:hypothetical protein
MRVYHSGDAVSFIELPVQHPPRPGS